MRRCWCTNENLQNWHESYMACPSCGTLVDQSEAENTGSNNDESSALYGANYWRQHMLNLYKPMGCKNFDDVILLHFRERAAHWLHFFLPRLLPPAKVLEVGCGVGSFTHWLSRLGYEASATELSPQWRAYLADKLGISVSDYCLSTESSKKNVFDAIVLLDVLEHLDNPQDMMASIANELKDDGIVFVQLPEYQQGTTFEALQCGNSTFLSMLLPREHVYLYSWQAVCEMFKQAGFIHMQRLPNIFAADMFFVASRHPFKNYSEEYIRRTFMKSPESILPYAAYENYIVMCKQMRAIGDAHRQG